MRDCVTVFSDTSLAHICRVWSDGQMVTHGKRWNTKTADRSLENTLGWLQYSANIAAHISNLRVGDAQVSGKCTVVSELWPKMPLFYEA